MLVIASAASLRWRRAAPAASRVGMLPAKERRWQEPRPWPGSSTSSGPRCTPPRTLSGTRVRNPDSPEPSSRVPLWLNTPTNATNDYFSKWIIILIILVINQIQKWSHSWDFFLFCLLNLFLYSIRDAFK